MDVRLAVRADLEACLQIGGHCTSDHVWQLTQQEYQGQITLMLNEVRLPRAMQVPYPRTPEDIIEVWRSTDLLLVADAGGRICGFVDARTENWHSTAHIANLIVADGYRRQGIGTKLLGAVVQWARSRRLQYVMGEAQAQNWPAICFFQKLGFEFAGFNDHYYRNQVALFFARHVS